MKRRQIAELDAAARGVARGVLADVCDRWDAFDDDLRRRLHAFAKMYVEPWMLMRVRAFDLRFDGRRCSGYGRVCVEVLEEGRKLLLLVAPVRGHQRGLRGGLAS